MAQRTDKPAGSGRTSPIVRLLAPLALIGTVLVLFIVISSSTGDGGSTSAGGGGGGGGGGGQGQKQQGSSKKQKTPKKYEIQPGDSLSTIADEFGISVDEIVVLNPKIDPQALVTGQELKLR